ncbi:hypothetical protein QFC21_000667 [Naganishia friedmannii]|uniref:Uncharacterized protein n=1 Tax=Naganishia friedmannii TaxID=89922 RepID=A0ACC2WD73_9TREE|nr:hypothetical protein QFC21_000667 [Naganishia friedmannii]
MAPPEKESTICRPEHTYYCMAVLEAELGNKETPDPDDYLTAEEKEASVSLLTPFRPTTDPLDWQIGLHGIHITFHVSGRRYSGTYLPDVMPAQGWNKVQAIQSLCRKAGYRGTVEPQGEVWRGIELKTYTSEKCARDWRDYRAWREGGRV